MSEKKRDRHGRWRSRTVAFRASDEEVRQIDEAVKLSGLTKQEYIITRLQNRDVVVKANPRVFKALKDTMAEILFELRRINTGGNVGERLLETIELVSAIFSGAMDETEEHKP